MPSRNKANNGSAEGKTQTTPVSSVSEPATEPATLTEMSSLWDVFIGKLGCPFKELDTKQPESSWQEIFKSLEFSAVDVSRLMFTLKSKLGATGDRRMYALGVSNPLPVEQKEQTGQQEQQGPDLEAVEELGAHTMHTSTLNLNKGDFEYPEKLRRYFEASPGKVVDKLKSFTKFVDRGDLARFMTKHEMFKQILTVQGSIVECGVHMGGGLMGWAQLSALLEHINHTRHVIGFDTFEGFPDLDAEHGDPSQLRNMMSTSGFDDDIRLAVELFDVNRYISHVPKVKLVKGDACKTIPAFVQANKHLVVSLLYLDFDIYQPTKVALEAFLPLMPKGAIVAFDEVNVANWPGETQAVLDVCGLRNLRLQRFPYHPQISYAVLE